MPRLSAPTQIVFIISLILAIAALVIFFVSTPALAFWTAIVAYVVLALGCMLTGV